MAMTREEMQRLASYGRDGDTMLAHINPQEAALLKQSGGSGTINPNTGLPEYRFGGKLTGGIKSVASIPVAAVNNPVAAVKSVAAPVVEPVSTLAQRGAASAENAIDTLKKAAASGGFIDSGGGGLISSITNPLQKAVSQVSSNISNLPGSVQNTVKQAAANPVAQIALAYYMPGLVAEFAPSLTALGISGSAAQTAVANAIASTAVQVAQGVPLDKALQSAVTNAVVSSGSATIAQDINKVMQNPAVTNAIVSAGSSAAKTALNGGSQSDIEKNLVAGLVGSGTATATGSNIAGSAVGGGITGGVTGALTSAASAYGAQVEAERLAKEKAAAESKPPTTASGFVSGTNLAAANTGTVSDAGGGMSVEVSGTPIFADSPRAASVRAPSGFAVMPIEMADNKPTGAYYDYTQNAWIAPLSDIEKFTKVSPIDSADPSAGRVSVAPGVDLTQPTTPPVSYDPTIITTGGMTSSTGGKTSTISGQTGTSNVGAAGGSGGKVTGTGTGTGGTGTGTGTGGTGTGTGGGTTPKQPMTGELSTVTVTASGEPEIVDESSVDKTPKELPPVEDKTGTPVPYDPRIFTYGGKSPSTLGTTLKTAAPFYPVAGTTGGLTSTRGAGEIESKETGKARKNVWNEASLRLKDALGV